MASNVTTNQASRAIQVILSDTINIPQPYEIANGSNTAVSAGELEDGAADFITSNVMVGDAVYNLTDGTIASVTSKISATVLKLSANIFTGPLKQYAIYTGNAQPNSFLLYVGTGGDLSIQTTSARPVLLKNVADASFLPINVGRVNASGTTASDIIALL
tara:strand:+ start:30 stop:509 length:480 start_codon:yes stop_codon:yes gene_type:complete